MAESFKYGNGVWATKEGSSLAYNDENDNYKPLPFSVTRDSIATRVNKEGLIEVVGKDKLRIDYTDSTKGVALLEPARTNLITYSEDFSDSSWVKVNSTISANQAISPTGENNASLLTATAATGGLFQYSQWTTTERTATFFVKKNTAKFIEILNASASANRVKYDLDNGTIDSESGSITGAIVNYGNGWYRLSATHTHTSTGTLGLRFPTSGESAYVWGAQLETGSYATSYIPTSGSATQRQADVANGAGNSEVFNDSEGVLFADIAALANDGTSRIISISDPSATNRIHLFYFVEANYIYANYRAGGTTRSTAQYEINNVLNPTKVAYKYKSGDFSLWINGFEVDTDTNTTMIADGTLTKLSFEQGNGGNNFYGKAKRIGVYDAVLTDAELEALTSYTSFTNMANELNLTIK